MRKLKTTRPEQGFTIIELLVATSVLAIILLLVTSMMISIGNLFYKGLNQARVQDSVRSIADELSQELELNSAPIHYVDSIHWTAPIDAVCLGNYRYSYVVGTQVNKKISAGGPVLNDVLWRDIPNGGCDQVTSAPLVLVAPANLARYEQVHGNTDGTELLPPNSRLTAFCIGSLNIATNICNYATKSPYTISIGIAYGDDDLLNLAGINTTCKGTIGDQFCATARISLTVANRLP